MHEETLSSPACSLPLDILHEILPYCLPPYPTIRSANHVMSTLSRVSLTWRTAVLSSPRLWSRLLVTLHKNDDLEHCAQMVAQWFQHAPTLSLSFFLNVDFEADDEDIARIAIFLARLSSVMLRVRHFALHSRLTTKLLRSFVDVEWKLPQLKILDLFSRLDEINGIAFSVSLFHKAPNLAKVAIGNAITWGTDIMHLLPWSQLTHIRLMYPISISRWIEVMNMCPQMRFCAVTIDENYYSPSCPPNSIHHSLERLLLDFSDGSVPFLGLLSLYQLPSLYMLRVHYHVEPYFNFPCPQGISALANLRFFSFKRGNKLPCKHITYLVEILREMVKLEKLELQPTTQGFIPLYEALSFNRPEEAILPQLRTLILWVSSVSRWEKDKGLQPLLGMLSSRSREDTIPVSFEPLKRFIVGVATEDIHERMRKLFDPWVEGLLSRLQFSIDLNRGTRSRSHQPEGWTQPISH